jgi:hypothetical protein
VSVRFLRAIEYYPYSEERLTEEPRMSYRDFTIEEVRRTFQLTFRDQPLFPEIGSIEPFDWLAHMLKEGRDLAVLSEKARSEFIVAPVLMACRELLQEKIHVFSGITLNAAPEQGLTGECDFILARTASSFAVQGPLVVVLEAKRTTSKKGWASARHRCWELGSTTKKTGRRFPLFTAV